MLERASYHPRSTRRDYAELLVLTGRVDEAIAQLEGLSASSPDVTVRLAELYRMRGRMGDYATGIDEGRESGALVVGISPLMSMIFSRLRGCAS